MYKLIIKYTSGLSFKKDERCLLKFDWDKCMGAHSYGKPQYINNSMAISNTVDSLEKYNNLLIPCQYHSETELYQVFILDVVEIERYLKLQQLDI